MTTNTGLSPFGLGTSRLGSLGGALSQKAATRLILAALDKGVTTIDTADSYGSGDAERMIGKALGKRRNECFLITKAGFRHATTPAGLSPLNQIGTKVLRKFVKKQNFAKRYLLECVEKSLKRLGTDHLDVFFLHEPLTEIGDETWEAFNQIRQRGLSRMNGISTSSHDVIEQAIQMGQVQIIQTAVLARPEKTERLLWLCSKSTIPVVANQVLTHRSRLDALGSRWRDVCAQYGVPSVSTARLLIACASVQPGVKSVLVGTKSIAHLVQDIEPLPVGVPLRPLAAEIERLLG